MNRMTGTVRRRATGSSLTGEGIGSFAPPGVGRAIVPPTDCSPNRKRTVRGGGGGG